MTALAVVAAVGAALLLVPARPAVGGLGGRGRRVWRVWVVPLVAVPVVLAVAGGTPRLALLAAIGGLAVLGAVRLLRSRSARREATRTSGRVLEACESLAAELAAGRPPGSALEVAAGDWPALAPVSEAFRVGADVPTAWRSVAGVPGARDLRVVAAAWQVAHRTGEGLADTLDHVARDLRGAQVTRRVVEGELASARATAKLVAALPVLALTMGSGAGGDPWGFLLGHPVGLGCLGLGLAFAFAGLAWIEALAREVDRP